MSFFIILIFAHTDHLTSSLPIFSFSILNASHLSLMLVLAKRMMWYFLSKCQVLFGKDNVLLLTWIICGKPNVAMQAIKMVNIHIILCLYVRVIMTYVAVDKTNASEPVLLLKWSILIHFLVDDKLKIDFIEIICFFLWRKHWLYYIILIKNKRKELVLT